MASALNLLSDWAGDGGERHSLLNSEKGLLVRWLNQAQLRFADKSEILQGVWSPTITSGGSIALPSDFLREIPDRVKWDSTTVLVKMDYADANVLGTSLSSTVYYSIWNNTLYVWAAAAGTPSIPYIKKPTAITVTTLSSADLEIPTEYHNDMIPFLDAMFSRKAGDIKGYLALMEVFDRKAETAGLDLKLARNAPLKTHGGFF